LYYDSTDNYLHYCIEYDGYTSLIFGIITLSSYNQTYALPSTSGASMTCIEAFGSSQISSFYYKDGSSGSFYLLTIDYLNAQY
jgi:hypothetical protein